MAHPRKPKRAEACAYCTRSAEHVHHNPYDCKAPLKPGVCIEKDIPLCEAHHAESHDDHDVE